MMNSKKNIFLLVLFFIACLSYLAYTENKQQDYDFGKTWWAVYFLNPQQERDLSFIIENHSSENSFHWEISAEKKTLSQGDEDIPLGEKKSVSVEPSWDILKNKKIIIKISTSKNSKELYKTFK
ncbi:MAG: hypothetical protein HGA61_03520 [Candidatus Moranbacteria bacterium]|nr:hypothetical protein [Candidatus Moranbacteria bacterium]